MTSRISICGSEDARERIFQVFDSIPDEIIMLDTNMIVEEANASFLANNSLKIEQVRGFRCYEVEQDIRGRCRTEVEDCPFFTVMERKKTVSRIRKHVDKDGNPRYCTIVGAPVLDKDGEVTGMIEMTRDITQLIRLETELKLKEFRLHQFMEMSPVAIYVKNRDGEYLEVNPAICALFQKDQNDIIGKTNREIFTRTVAEALNTGDDRVLRSGKEIRLNTKIAFGDRQVYLSTMKYPILDPNGEVVAVCGLSEDVTAQKKNEQELTSTREYLENILKNSPVIIITADLEGRVVSFNRGAEKALGYTSDEVRGQGAGMFYSDREQLRRLMRRVEEKGDVRDIEMNARRKDGSTFPITITISQLKDSTGNTMGTVGISKDISHRKALMEQVMQSDRQAAVGRLAGGVAHEINNPLAMIGEISGYLEDLVSGGPGADAVDIMEELREGLPKIRKHVSRGRSITHRLLSFARKTQVMVEAAEVNASIEEILPFIEKEANLAQISIHEDYEPDLPKVAVEEMLLQEIFINLIKNAIQAMGSTQKAGNLWITTRKNGSKIAVTVRDDGPGIADEVRDHLFDPFVTTKPPGKGTGLGLSICYGIIKRYDGEIRVDSVAGKGATFKVILPIIKEQIRK